MIVESNKVIYSDGRHNAFTSMVKWRDRYWVTFRNGTRHRAHDGRILVISSSDLEHWSGPTVAIDTSMDDRDPHLVVFQDRLFVATGSVDRKFENDEHLDGKLHVSRLVTALSVTDDGVTWEEAWVAGEPFHFLWWMMAHDGYIYGAAYESRTTVEAGIQIRECRSKLVRSGDGRKWEQVAIISDERLASETSIAFLPDGRAIALVRHNEDVRPEVKMAESPYETWQNLIHFPFEGAGPCLGLVGETIVLSARAFLDKPDTPLVTPDVAPRNRGLLVMTADLARREVNPKVLIPHSIGPLTRDDPGYHVYPSHVVRDPNAPDISYASIVDLGDGRFIMSYYDGHAGGPSDIRLAQLRLD